MKKLSLFAFFLLFIFTVQAQTDFRPGFVVNATGDTLLQTVLPAVGCDCNRAAEPS